jgi:hypothetical protein
MFFNRKKKSSEHSTQQQSSDSSNGPVVAYTSYDSFEVATIKSMLDSAGIEFHVTNELVTGYGPMFSSDSGMDVLVRPEDADDARTIIKQLSA